MLTFPCKMCERPSQNICVSREKFQLGGFESDKDWDFEKRRKTIERRLDVFDENYLYTGRCGSRIVQGFC